MDELSRRKFLLASGVAATSAAVVAAPKLAGVAGDHGARAAGEQAAVIEPTHPAPAEPVMAYVRDAANSEVTVMAGTRETTYREPELTRRLLRAAPAVEGGETGVIAP
jgi:hypothetical protein